MKSSNALELYPDKVCSLLFPWLTNWSAAIDRQSLSGNKRRQGMYRCVWMSIEIKNGVQNRFARNNDEFFVTLGWKSHPRADHLVVSNGGALVVLRSGWRRTQWWWWCSDVGNIRSSRTLFNNHLIAFNVKFTVWTIVIYVLTIIHNMNTQIWS